MALVTADVGAVQILKSYFKKEQPAGGNNLTLKLYTSNTTPNANGGDTAGTYTEAAGGGYAAITLTAANWTVANNNPADAVYAQQTFTFTGALDGGATIYGYFVVDADGVLIWAERASGTMTPASNGDTYKITPKYQLSYGTPAA